MTQSKSPRGNFFKIYVVDALSYMAMGLFCSLILGLIIGQIAKIPGCDILSDIARLLQLDLVVGGSIGLAIALGLKRDPLVTISAVAVGALGYSLGGNWGDVGGNPIGAYLAAIVGIALAIVGPDALSDFKVLIFQAAFALIGVGLPALRSRTVGR